MDQRWQFRTVLANNDWWSGRMVTCGPSRRLQSPSFTAPSANLMRTYASLRSGSWIYPDPLCTQWTTPQLLPHPEAWQGTQLSVFTGWEESFLFVTFPAPMCKWTPTTRLVNLCQTCSNLHSVCWLCATRLTVKHGILMQCLRFQLRLSWCPYKKPVAICMAAPSAHMHKARCLYDK
jgi:hypothetical protein